MGKCGVYRGKMLAFALVKKRNGKYGKEYLIIVPPSFRWLDGKGYSNLGG